MKKSESFTLDWDTSKVEQRIMSSAEKFGSDEYDTTGMDLILDSYRNKIIPNRFNPSEIDSFLSSPQREDIIQEQGYAIITEEWINPLVDWIGNRKVLEVMSGCGSLAKALQDRGVDIVATDDFSWDGLCSWNTINNYWVEIENIDCLDALEKYKDREILIMSWPYMDDTCLKVLKKMRQVNPSMLMIYIGEPKGGATACDEFFEEITVIEDKEFNKIIDVYPQWRYIYDKPYLVK